MSDWDDLNQDEVYTSDNPMFSSGYINNNLTKKQTNSVPSHIQTLQKHRSVGKKYKTFLKVTVPILAGLFNSKEDTVRKWIREKKINPYSLEDIIDKYNNRHKLDRRRKPASHLIPQEFDHERGNPDKGCASQ